MSLVKMQRDGKLADVHPDEVANWKEHGWSVIEEAETKIEPKKKKKDAVE